MRPTVVITHRVHREVTDLLAERCLVAANDSLQPLPRDELLHRAKNATALMVSMSDSVDENFLKACPRLKIIAGILKGFDNFDVAACTRRNIWFTIVPDLTAAPTADLAMGLLIALARRIPEGDRFVRTGGFRGWRPHLYGMGVTGKTLGLIGFGEVGRAVARRAHAFDMKILAFDRMPSRSWERKCRVSFVSLERLLSESDFVMPLLPLTPQTFHIIDADAISAMKRGSIIVNVGRGSLLDEEAVAEALRSGRLAGYGADVFEMEDRARANRPMRIPSRLIEDEARTCLTPHLGSAVDEVRKEMGLKAARSILEALEGIHPRGAVAWFE